MILYYTDKENTEVLDILTEKLNDKVVTITAEEDIPFTSTFSGTPFVVVYDLTRPLCAADIDKLDSFIFEGSKILYCIFALPEAQKELEPVSIHISEQHKMVLFGYDFVVNATKAKNNSLKNVSAAKISLAAELIREARPFSKIRALSFPLRATKCEANPFSV